MSTMNSDHSGVVDMYESTTNGSYFTKHTKVNENGESNDRALGEDTAATVVTQGQPTDFDVDAWEAFFRASTMSEARLKIMLEALDCKRKGVIYHQLRPGTGRPGACCCGCSAETGSLWYAGYENNYDFATQAAYNIEDPLYLDCSYFVKHCYWAAGLEMASSNTGGLVSTTEFVTIPREQLLPGDIWVKSGHTVIFVAFDANGGAIWIEMGGHADDCKFSAYEQTTGVYRRFAALMDDTEFIPAKAGTRVSVENSTASTENTQAGVNEIAWDSAWEFAKDEMKHPDKLNKYVPDDWNGKTVFLNPGHGDGTALASNIPNDPVSSLQNQYSGSSSAGHTTGTNYTTSGGKRVSEAKHVLDVCSKTKDLLLDKGYAVVMARESLVNNFENSARSVWANNTADIHVAVHIDSGTHGPGWYRGDSAQQAHANASRWYASGAKLGEFIEQACSRTLGKPVHTGLSGKLTGYCYSTIPCAYIELYGVESEEMADFADTHVNEAAQGIADGIDAYFGGN